MTCPMNMFSESYTKAIRRMVPYSWCDLPQLYKHSAKYVLCGNKISWTQNVCSMRIFSQFSGRCGGRDLLIWRSPPRRRARHWR